MFRFFQIFVLVFALFINSGSCLASSAQDRVILTVPEAVITETVRELLPFDLDTDSDTLSGTITVIDVKNLQLGNNLISCKLHLLGKHLSIITKIAGHSIKLRAGEMELDFSTDIATRFDKKQNKLILTPQIRSISQSRDQADGQLGKTLVSLIDHQEFPVDLNKMKPINAKAGNKNIRINFDLIDAKITPEGLQLYLIPKISSQTRTTG